MKGNSINTEVGTTYLSYLGCEVTSAVDGQEALDLVKNNTFELIFMNRDTSSKKHTFIIKKKLNHFNVPYPKVVMSKGISRQ